MVEVVAGHGFEQGLKGEEAAFRVEALPGEVFRGDGGEQGEVPLPAGAEECEGGRDFAGLVAGGPGFLVERLQERRWGSGGVGENLAEAPGKGQLAIGQVGEDLAGAPLSFAVDGGGEGGFELLGGEGAGGFVEEAWSGGEDFVEAAVGEVVGVGVHEGQCKAG